MLKTTISAALHTFAALYILVLTLLSASFANAKFMSAREPRLLIPIGIAGVILETYAAARQWRTPVSGLSFSIVLHFLFAATVLTVISFEYFQAPPAQLGSWLAVNNFFFILFLALARIIVGVSLLFTKSSSS